MFLYKKTQPFVSSNFGYFLNRMAAPRLHLGSSQRSIVVADDFNQNTILLDLGTGKSLLPKNFEVNQNFSSFKKFNHFVLYNLI